MLCVETPYYTAEGHVEIRCRAEDFGWQAVRVSTFGSAVVDAFYLIGSDLDEARIGKAVLAAAQT